MSTTTTALQSPSSASLEGRRVLVIGGTSGIGAAAVRLLAGLGAVPLAASRSATAPDLRLDIDDGGALARMAANLDPLDHVFVTAAAFAAGPVGEVPAETADAVALSRLSGALSVARVFASRLEPGGSLTFTSAIGAVRPQPGLSAASASAAGVEGLARALALELAPVRVNVVRPGATDTPLLRAMAPDDAAVAAFGAGLPLGRVARPEEVAAAALFLMTNPAITGTVVSVDGGGSLV